MPLNLAQFNIKYKISKVCGQEKQRHYLESLGFIAGSEIELLSEIPWLLYCHGKRKQKLELKRVWQKESSYMQLKLMIMNENESRLLIKIWKRTRLQYVFVI